MDGVGLLRRLLLSNKKSQPQTIYPMITEAFQRGNNCVEDVEGMKKEEANVVIPEVESIEITFDDILSSSEDESNNGDRTTPNKEIKIVENNSAEEALESECNENQEPIESLQRGNNCVEDVEKKKEEPNVVIPEVESVEITVDDILISSSEDESNNGNKTTPNEEIKIVENNSVEEALESECIENQEPIASRGNIISDDPFYMESTSEEKEMLVLNDPHAVQNDILNPRSNYKWAVNNKVPKNGRKNKVKETEFIVTETGEFQCLQCEFDVTKGLQRRHKMVQHILSEHRDVKKLHQCPHCPFKSPYGLNSHILSKHTSEKDIHWIKCDKCDYKCKKKHQLNKHSIVHYNDGDLPLIELMEKNKCTICEKGFKGSDTLKKHIQQIHKKQKTKLHCDHCDYTNPENFFLQRHIEVTHTDSKHLKIHRCQKCSYGTKFIHRLDSHMRAQHSTRQFLFVKEGRQMLVASTNPGETNFKVVCEICGYTSHSATKLRLHQITHQKKIDEKELKYRCHKCDYKTYRLYSFKIHKLNHLKPSQIKYFYCYHCDFKGKRKDNLKTHILRHFKKEEVTLKCYLCEFSTKKRQSLTDHLSMKHTNKNQ